MELVDKLEALKTVVNLKNLKNREKVIEAIFHGIFGKDPKPTDTITYKELATLGMYYDVLKTAFNIVSLKEDVEFEIFFRNLERSSRKIKNINRYFKRKYNSGLNN